MADRVEYSPPKISTWNQENGGAWAAINRPITGPTHDKPLPIGHHPLQLYSLGTPNGVKVTVMLEELLALGHVDAEYDAWLITMTVSSWTSRRKMGRQIPGQFLQRPSTHRWPWREHTRSPTSCSQLF